MRYIQTFESFENLNQVFYSCMKEPINFSKFIEQEVYTKKAFTQEDIKAWMEKYFITLDDKVLWVSPDRRKCYRFASSKDIDPEIKEYTLSDGFIVSESDDTRDSFLMVLRDSISQN